MNEILEKLQDTKEKLNFDLMRKKLELEVIYIENKE